MSARHLPVLAQRCIDLLAPALRKPGAVMVDGTLGLGGHAELVLQQIPEVTVIGIDRDPQALKLASERLSIFQHRFRAFHSTYDRIPEVIHQAGFHHVDGILLDLGISSMQIDEAARGFSYSNDAPLDMRMDQTQGQTAADILNNYSEADLRKLLWEFAEEKFAPRIAANIMARRQVKPWETTAELAATIDRSIPAKAKRTGGHPAKRTFQALRIEVNQELSGLQKALPAAIDCLAVGGRIVIESYQSLEDRLVKKEFAKGFTSSAPPGLPMPLPEHLPYLQPVTRGAEQADELELAHNSRAASVRLRAAQKIRDTNLVMHRVTDKRAQAMLSSRQDNDRQD